MASITIAIMRLLVAAAMGLFLSCAQVPTLPFKLHRISLVKVLDSCGKWSRTVLHGSANVRNGLPHLHE